MKQLSMLDIIQQLVQNGHKIEYRKRKDGGVLITSLDGVKYKLAQGNTLARKMVGSTLSEARKIQLERIKPLKNQTPKERKRGQLPKELKSKLRKVQRIWRKEHPSISGSVSTKGLRYHYEKYGKEEALRSLDKAEKYALGIAYEENVEWLAQRIEINLNKEFSSEMESIVNLIRSKSQSFKEEWIQVIYEIVYQWEQGSLSIDEAERQIRQTLQ